MGSGSERTFPDESMYILAGASYVTLGRNHQAKMLEKYLSQTQLLTISREQVSVRLLKISGTSANDEREPTLEIIALGGSPVHINGIQVQRGSPSFARAGDKIY